MLLNFLGRGSAFNTKEGNNSAYIRINDEIIFLDCGESTFEKIIKTNILEGVNKVSVFITHLHSDHVGSLSSLLYYCYFKKQILATVYFPTNEIVSLLKVFDNRDNVDYNFVQLKSGKEITANFAKVTPISVSHIDSLSSFGYILYIKEKLIWYSGDCNEISNVINEYNFDEIYHDTCLAEYKGNVHTSLRVLEKKFRKEIRNKVYCMHIDCDELIEKAKKLGFNVVEVKS